MVEEDESEVVCDIAREAIEVRPLLELRNLSFTLLITISQTSIKPRRYQMSKITMGSVGWRT